MLAQWGQTTMVSEVGEVRVTLVTLTEQHDGGLLGKRVDSKKPSAIEPCLKASQCLVAVCCCVVE